MTAVGTKLPSQLQPLAACPKGEGKAIRETSFCFIVLKVCLLANEADGSASY